MTPASPQLHPSLTSGYPRVASASFQRLKLDYDKLVPKSVNNSNLRRYTLVEAMPRAKPQLEVWGCKLTLC